MSGFLFAQAVIWLRNPSPQRILARRDGIEPESERCWPPLSEFKCAQRSLAATPATFSTILFCFDQLDKLICLTQPTLCWIFFPAFFLCHHPSIKK